MSGARELDAPRLVCSSRCECGNSAEGGGIYPCDSEGHKMASSDLLYCDRCDKITVRETGHLFAYRSQVVSA
jgi:hypothetical protein